MGGDFIDLTDGTRIEIKVNFGTLYWLQMSDRHGLFSQSKNKKKKQLTDRERMESAAQLIYAILRSNGQKVTFDEALELMPADMDVLKDVMQSFSDKLNKYKKKEQSSNYMKQQGKTNMKRN